MRARTVVGIGFAAVLVIATIAAVAIGPLRLRHLACRVTTCTPADHVQTLCGLAEAQAFAPAPERRSIVENAFADSWPPAGAKTWLDAVRHAEPGAEYDAIADAIESEPSRDLFCPALVELYAAPVAVTPQRVVVQGRTLARLSQSELQTSSLDPNGLGIEGLRAALGYGDDGSPLTVQVSARTSALTLMRVSYSLGLAGVPRMNLRLAARTASTAQNSIPVVFPIRGTCPSCLLDLAEVKYRDPTDAPRVELGVVGRPGERTTWTRDDVDALVLPRRGGFSLAAGGGWPAAAVATPQALRPAPSPRAVLLLVAAPTRTADELITATRGVLGNQSPYAFITLAVPQPVLQNSARFDEAFEGRTSVAVLRRPADGSPPPGRTTRTARRKTSGPGRTRGSFGAKGSVSRTTRRPPPVIPALGSDAELAESIRPKLRSLQDCYERALKGNRRLRGKVTLQFDINRAGRLEHVQVQDHSLGSPDVTRCIRRRVRNWRLPVPSEEGVTVSYPLVFAPSGF